jgi:uncharacterized membrane protein
MNHPIESCGLPSVAQNLRPLVGGWPTIGWFLILLIWMVNIWLMIVNDG